MSVPSLKIGVWIFIGFTIQFNYVYHVNDSIQLNMFLWLSGRALR